MNIEMENAMKEYLAGDKNPSKREIMNKALTKAVIWSLQDNPESIVDKKDAQEIPVVKLDDGKFADCGVVMRDVGESLGEAIKEVIDESKAKNIEKYLRMK